MGLWSVTARLVLNRHRRHYKALSGPSGLRKVEQIDSDRCADYFLSRRNFQGVRASGHGQRHGAIMTRLLQVLGRVFGSAPSPAPASRAVYVGRTRAIDTDFSIFRGASHVRKSGGTNLWEMKGPEERTSRGGFRRGTCDQLTRRYNRGRPGGDSPEAASIDQTIEKGRQDKSSPWSCCARKHHWQSSLGRGARA